MTFLTGAVSRYSLVVLSGAVESMTVLYSLFRRLSRVSAISVKMRYSSLEGGVSLKSICLISSAFIRAMFE